MCRLFLDHVKERRAKRPELTGVVVNITSTPALTPIISTPLATSFAKAGAVYHTQAVAGMGRHLATGLFGDERIRVNTITLGSLTAKEYDPRDDPDPGGARREARSESCPWGTRTTQ